MNAGKNLVKKEWLGIGTGSAGKWSSGVTLPGNVQKMSRCGTGFLLRTLLIQLSLKAKKSLLPAHQIILRKKKITYFIKASSEDLLYIEEEEEKMREENLGHPPN